jgi:hypothetical protein
MKSAIILTTALLLSNTVNADNELNLNEHMQTALTEKVNTKITQQIDAAYFEYDRSWIIDEVVVVGKRTSPEDYASHGNSLESLGNDNGWRWSVSK